jgi:hypothetical protein
MSAPLTRCGSSPPLGSVSGSRSSIGTPRVNARLAPSMRHVGRLKGEDQLAEQPGEHLFLVCGQGREQGTFAGRTARRGSGRAHRRGGTGWLNTAGLALAASAAHGTARACAGHRPGRCAWPGRRAGARRPAGRRSLPGPGPARRVPATSALRAHQPSRITTVFPMTNAMDEVIGDMDVKRETITAPDGREIEFVTAGPAAGTRGLNAAARPGGSPALPRTPRRCWTRSAPGSSGHRGRMGLRAG